jgi:hypothetical protein
MNGKFQQKEAATALDGLRQTFSVLVLICTE